MDTEVTTPVLGDCSGGFMRFFVVILGKCPFCRLRWRLLKHEIETT